MKKIILTMVAGILAISMILTPLVVANPVAPMTLSGTKIATGITGPDGYFKYIIAGMSGVTQIKMKDAFDVFSGGIEGTGHYFGSWWLKMSPLGEFEGIHINGYWIFEGVTIDDVTYTGTLRIGQNGEELWIESGTGDLSSIRGRGTATYILPEIYQYSVFTYEMDIYINP